VNTGAPAEECPGPSKIAEDCVTHLTHFWTAIFATFAIFGPRKVWKIWKNAPPLRVRAREENAIFGSGKARPPRRTSSTSRQCARLPTPCQRLPTGGVCSFPHSPLGVGRPRPLEGRAPNSPEPRGAVAVIFAPATRSPAISRPVAFVRKQAPPSRRKGVFDSVHGRTIWPSFSQYSSTWLDQLANDAQSQVAITRKGLLAGSEYPPTIQ